MKRIVALLLTLLMVATMMVACSSKENEDPVAANDLADDAVEAPADEEPADEEPADEEPADEAPEETVEETSDDAEIVAAYVEIAKQTLDDEHISIEARGTDVVLVYTFDESYDDEALISVMASFLEEEMLNEEFYSSFVDVKDGCPQMTSLIVEFVDANGTLIYSCTFDDNTTLVENADEGTDSNGEGISDEKTVQYIADYINESGALDDLGVDGMAFNVYAEGTVLCIDMIVSDVLLSSIPEGSIGMLEDVIAESFDLDSMQESTPALSGINVRILDNNGTVLVSSELR